ncbi:histidinol-phosphate transaminase [Kibdelosporangium phytohabitans]|uniref:Aromatic amino acid aminotransferase n=1 Tax=Kibdelosporangium phytohabitans TaxID=860235 RepID=A0A0N7F2F8_9PSEU|nr:histidinol-phosphate transaminase [Kibdelosporangium phytohabitans]ALG05711.1 aminotransferase [Kibdelosporangium phytohabitans]
MSYVQPRADLASLPSYVPGRTIPGAIKLASNEVPAGPLPSVTKAIADAAAHAHRYPDSGAGELTARLAAKLGVPESRIAVGCGSVSLCQQLIQATCTERDEVLFAWRSFEAYPIVTHVVGAKQVRVPLTDDHALDLDAMLAAITPRTRLVFVCTPNNPTGTLVRKAELDRFIEAVPSNVLVVLDEAYFEFVTDPDATDGIDYLRERDNVAVLRTFSKAYGLAGLRVGYCVTSEEVATAVRKVYVPFSVNHLAQAAAIASLDAEQELFERVLEIKDERIRVRDELVAAGYDVPETQANFVWLPLGDRTAAFNEHCLANKLVVRAFAGEGARVTISTAEENDLFLAAAKSFSR